MTKLTKKALSLAIAGFVAFSSTFSGAPLTASAQETEVTTEATAVDADETYSKHYQVEFDKPGTWTGTLYAYAYYKVKPTDPESKLATPLDYWPGTKVEPTNGTYSIDIPNNAVDGLNVIFINLDTNATVDKTATKDSGPVGYHYEIKNGGILNRYPAEGVDGTEGLWIIGDSKISSNFKVSPMTTATATPTVTPTTTPVVTTPVSVTATPSTEPTGTPITSPTVEPVATVEATSDIPTATPEITATPVVTPEVTTPVVSPVATPVATPVVTPEVTPVVTATATASAPAITATPAATTTPVITPTVAPTATAPAPVTNGGIVSNTAIAATNSAVAGKITFNKIGKTVGETVKITAKVTSGSAVYYTFTATKSGKTTTIATNTKKSSVNWIPTAKGTYTIEVTLYDKDKKQIGTLTNTYKVKTRVITIKKFKTNKKSGQKKGTKVVISANAATTKGSLRYKFVVKNSKGKAVLTRKYSKKKSVVWKAKSKGTYTLNLFIQNGKGVEVSKTKTFKIK